MSTLTITLTIDQATAMARMLDLATGVRLIQFREIGWLARTGAMKHASGRSLINDELDTLDYLLDRVSSVFGFQPNASFGIGSEHVSKDVQRGWEIKKVVDKALVEHREPHPSGMRTVNYDGLVVRYTNDPAPVAEVQQAV